MFNSEKYSELKTRSIKEGLKTVLWNVYYLLEVSLGILPLPYPYLGIVGVSWFYFDFTTLV